MRWFESVGARWRMSIGCRRPESRVAVEFFLGERGDAEGAARQLFGRTLKPWEYAGLAGALDGARVEVGTLSGRLYIELSGPPHETYRTVLCIARDRRSLVIAHEGFQIVRRQQQGCGLGLRVFTRQLDHAQRLEIRHIKTVAGRACGENGYYTWPRFGFDAPLPLDVRRTLPPGLVGAACVLDVMACPVGRQWWRHYGTPLPLTFDLEAGSRSWETFRDYVRQRRN